jgi:hypothetical protein
MVHETYIKAQQQASPVSHEIMPRRFKTWIVSDRELNTIGFLSALDTVLVTALGIAAGAALTLGITLNTVDIPVVQTRSNYVAAFIVALGFTSLLFVFAAVSLIRKFLDVRKIKKESEQEKRRLDVLNNKPHTFPNK